MRGKSSSSSPKSKNGGVEIEKVEKVEEPHLSGAYIRSLVKQLTSSRTKDSSNPKGQEVLEGEGISMDRNCVGLSDHHDKHEKSNHNHPHPHQQHKKQVRRRLHTSRPYQERLLNMAEARREIVTALKFHRAAMKQASEKQQQLESGPEIQPLSEVSLEQEAKLKSRRNPRIYASNSSRNSSSSDLSKNYLDNVSYSTGFCSSYISWPFLPVAPPPPPPLPLVQENLNFALPSQTLGLNLNLQDFNNIDTNPFLCGTNPSSIYSSSTPSTSSSPAATEEIQCMAVPPCVVENEMVELGDSGLHPVMDDQEMAEIRSIGEQHQMEWNDTMSLVTSAWWFKFLKTMEVETENQKAEDYVNAPFDEVLEFPAWLNTNDSCLQHLNDDYFQDPSLPCMEIEEIEGMDVDWLA